MKYDVLIIGAGLSGLTAAALLAKKGLKVAVAEKNHEPGGSCGTFKRPGAVFDQGSAMLYGFGDKGFNAHRFVFNCLEEPIDVIRNDMLYCVNFMGHRIRFWPDIDKFIEELSVVFPDEADNISRFYKDTYKMYQHVMVEDPTYTTPDETDLRSTLKSMMKHPLSYVKFLSYLNKSAEDILKKYFSDPEIFNFFDKLTSTYCYATVKEAPAVLAAVMFVDNHVGGSFYPAGSTMFLPGKLEKVIEENGGDIFYNSEVTQVLFGNGRADGGRTKDGREIFADDLIYSGTVWNLYSGLIGEPDVSPEKIKWALSQVPTYPSVVLYALVDADVIPADTQPVEMLVGNPEKLDESEVTAYIFSINDKTLCDENSHVVMAIGPNFDKWDRSDKVGYAVKKEKEKERLISVMERRFPGFKKAVKYSEIATPCTIERYTNKNGGAVAGPKQMLGQHMLKRMHTKTQWDNLYCCGESTVMGTGTPTVTTSGLSAANVILRKRGIKSYQYVPRMKNYVIERNKPFYRKDMYTELSQARREIAFAASRCRFCEYPECISHDIADIRGIMRRSAVGNFKGAGKLAKEIAERSDFNNDILKQAESRCVLNKENAEPVAIDCIIRKLINGFGNI